mmetsp:Transcript_12249/g.34541  ORF Transcript_12249/g.34541 Transcript_12249/m.34541 type:complete len:87 (+) Transcript_12249:371-631(+)
MQMYFPSLSFLPPSLSLTLLFWLPLLVFVAICYNILRITVFLLMTWPLCLFPFYLETRFENRVEKMMYKYQFPCITEKRCGANIYL